MLKRLISIATLLLLVSSVALAQEPADKVKAYYDSLKDGLSVSDLEQIRPLTAEEKTLAEALLNLQSGGARSRYNDCCSNLKNYGTALEMWSTDHDGNFPQDGESIHPYYLAFGVACPNSDRKPYGYELKDGVYYIRCSGDHSDYGVEPPTYNGEMGLANYVQSEDAPEQTWKLKDYKITEIPNEFDNDKVLRIAETWTNGKTEKTFNSQISPLVQEGQLVLTRPVALTSQNIFILEGDDANKTVMAFLQPVPLVSDDLVIESFETLGPALSGITVLRFLDNDDLADTRALLLKVLSSDD